MSTYKKLTETDEYKALQAADTTLQTNIDSEATARADADTTLQANIDSEATARADADTTLQTNIDSEATARADADTTLQENIDTEAAAREAADTTLQENIDSEATAREAADTTLQENIDALSTTVSSTVGGTNTDYVSNIAITQASGYPNAVHFTVQKGNSVQYKFSLATATTSVPGLMSPDDKTNLDTLTSGSFTGASYNQSTRYINFTNAAGTTVASVLMVWASSSRAGLMSAGDKKKLDAYPDWETLDARIAALESAE